MYVKNLQCTKRGWSLTRTDSTFSSLGDPLEDAVVVQLALVVRQDLADVAVQRRLVDLALLLFLLDDGAVLLTHCVMSEIQRVHVGHLQYENDYIDFKFTTFSSVKIGFHRVDHNMMVVTL